jgi:tRNA-2-methylthio-N6-dimethylallyladenosine synthase
MGSETYMIRTFGCQMNKHDSERVAGMLTARGLCAVDNVDDADVVVFMTCCVRENAEERLYGQVASLKNAKSVRPGQLIAVGGCIGQRDGERLLARAPHVDIVFGTHNISHLPALLEAAERRARPCVEILSEGPGYIAELPTEREHPWHAWVPVTVGCDNHCTYCIVPKVRGTQRSRELSEVAAEVERLVAEGVLEITLLGQNVNSYGLDRYGDVRFAELLGAVAQTGIPRIRFVTSHPKDLSDDTIDAMASLDNVMPSLHLPMQSG